MERDASRNEGEISGLDIEEAKKMTTETTIPGYSHTQKGPLCLIMYVTALACIVLVWVLNDKRGIFRAETVGLPNDFFAPAFYVLTFGGLLNALVAPAFHFLTVEDRGDVLAVRFGPVPLFRRYVRYADIEKAEVGRSRIIDGWGIHYSLLSDWGWNLWGRDCVIVHLKKGALRIGSDDAESLARFLKGKISEPRQ